MQSKEYKETFAISQSAIKAFKKKSLYKFKRIFIDGDDDDFDESKFAYGSLLDTRSFSDALFKERFFIIPNDTDVPGDKVKLIVDKVYKEALVIIENKQTLNKQGNLPEPLDIPSMSDLTQWNELITKYAAEIKYGGEKKPWSTSRILDNIHSDGYNYFRLLSQSQGRTIITVADNADAVESVNKLRFTPETLAYFVEQENEHLLHQHEIFIEYTLPNGKNVPLKGTTDIIRIDILNKTVQVADLKYTRAMSTFVNDAIEFGYGIQGSFYKFLVSEWIKTYRGGIYASYKLLPFIDIAIDREYKNPQIFEFIDDELDILKLGSVDKGVIGWVSTLGEISWHIESGIWDKPKELHEQGKIKINIFK